MTASPKKGQKLTMALLAFDRSSMSEYEAKFWNDLDGMTQDDMFPFDFLKIEIPNATYETVILKPSPEILAKYIEIAKKLEENETESICGITTLCGFNIIFQKKLMNSVHRIPVYTSSLLQLPLILSVTNSSHQILIVTLDANVLDYRHFQDLYGITYAVYMRRLKVLGINTAFQGHCVGELSKLTVHRKNGCKEDDTAPVNRSLFVAQVCQLIEMYVKAQKDNTRVKFGAIVLECTAITPCSKILRQRLRIPVFDIATLVHYSYDSIVGHRNGPPMAKL